MGAAVLPFPQRRDPSRWQIDEIAECYRVLDILGSVGMSVVLDADVSDEGDPWLVFVREDSQDVIIHITRIGGQVIAASAASESLFRGRTMRDVLQRILQAQPFVLPASRPLGADDRLLMHPATMLVAVVATAFLASQEAAALAGDGEAAFITLDGRSVTEPASAGRKQPLHLDTGNSGRAAPASDTHAPFTMTVASAVLAAVAVIAGEQILRPTDLLREETFTASFTELTNEAKHPAVHLLASDMIGIDPDLDPLHRQVSHSVLASDDARAAAFEHVNEHNVSSSTNPFPELRAAASVTGNFSAQDGLQASGIQLNTQDMAAPLTFAGQLTPKAGSGLDATIMGGAGFIIGAYSPNPLSSTGVTAKAAALAAQGTVSSPQISSFSEGGPIQQAASLSPSGFISPASAAQAASGFSQATAGSASPTSVASVLMDFSASSVDAKLPLAKMSLSVSDLFWHSAAVMRATGIDFYNATRTSGTTVEIADAKPLSDRSTANALLDPKSLLDDHGRPISGSPTKITADSLLTSATTTFETGAMASRTTPDTASTITKLASEGTALAGPPLLEGVATVSRQAHETSIQTARLSATADSATATKLLPAVPTSSGQEPAMVRSAAEIVQAVQSMVSFAYDPRHEIVLKGQDLEILQILVKANPLIAGADRVLLSRGQILAGDGVMLMPGVALLPAEVFVPKLAASLPTVQEGALEIFFRDDLTVTLAGVIDI